ncbi:MAG TPA: family 43 glycosylhydrolase, partial [Stackebrandtia sp.]|uniref:family 43 glycosylhydrolase n=1 Tax=Stackebrandtia sp. TaxID=2023065 RepID=UPI002D4639AD
MPRRSLLRAALGGGALLGAAPLFATAASAASDTRPAPDGRRAAAHRWIGAGPMKHVYDPSPSDADKRYLNDHCVIRDADGTWHLFAITGKTAPPGKVPDSAVEDNLAHATAPDLNGPWTTRPYALTTDPSYHGEDHLWAPHVVEHDGTYYMFYAAGAADPDDGWAINLATSTNLTDWTRDPDGPLFRHGLAARDPMVRRVGDQWVLYYTEVSDDNRHMVAARTSTDLRHWGDARAVYTDAVTADTVSVTESPFVVERDGWWYLFIGTRNGYVGTDVFASRDPLAFKLKDYAGHVPAHCAEVVRDGDDWWVTAAGWFEDGLNLAPLHWRDAPPLWHSPANPAAALDAAGDVRLFALAEDRSTLLSRGLDGDWEEFGTDLATVPTVGADKDGRLEVFALRSNGTAATRSQRADGSWGEW